MIRVLAVLLCLLIALALPSEAQESLARLPAPVAAYGAKFASDCRDNKLGSVVVNEAFIDALRSEDVNGDGIDDHIVYRCMFGCSGKAAALTGTGTACPFGALLLSGPTGHREIFLPGMVNRMVQGEVLKIALTRPRALRLVGNFCSDPFADYDPQYVYALKDGRFQLLAACPEAGCEVLLN
jgi:hypothetical protein